MCNPRHRRRHHLILCPILIGVVSHLDSVFQPIPVEVVFHHESVDWVQVSEFLELLRRSNNLVRVVWGLIRIDFAYSVPRVEPIWLPLPQHHYVMEVDFEDQTIWRAKEFPCRQKVCFGWVESRWSPHPDLDWPRIAPAYLCLLCRIPGEKANSRIRVKVKLEPEETENCPRQQQKTRHCSFFFYGLFQSTSLQSISFQLITTHESLFL